MTNLSVSMRRLSHFGTPRVALGQASQPIQAPVATDTRTALVERTDRAIALAALWCI